MPIPSKRLGMGGVPFDGGATFRVWAPFASEVSVAGNFNNWQAGHNLLARGETGYWSCDVAGASIGDQYKFVLRNPAIRDPFWKNDPYARALTNSVGNSILAETGVIRQNLGYSTPPWNEW
jgi:1,4-alpha-glucan branching enzyme